MTTSPSIEDTTRFASYVYAYPHKTAYRRIEPALPLGPLWATERRDVRVHRGHGVAEGRELDEPNQIAVLLSDGFASPCA